MIHLRISVNKYFLILILSLTITLDCFSQSVKNDSNKYLIDTSLLKLANPNIIKNSFIFSDKSDSVTVNDFIWSDKRNLSEILFESGGFISNFLIFGGRNEFSYNGFSPSAIGVFRDGIQINDLLFGGYDNENIPVNEISSIELTSDVTSFLYGMNSRGKAVNIITKDKFYPYVFTQLRYSQDRYDALSADVRFNIPFSKKFQAIIGVADKGSSGRYKNSDIGIWNASAKLNYYSSKKINLKFSFHYTDINRQLNEGLVNSSKDTLVEPILAVPLNSSSYEKIRNYDVSLTALSYVLDKSNVTSFSVHTANSFRQYRDGENIYPQTSEMIFNNFHSLRYEAILSQTLNLKILKNISSALFVSGEAVYDIARYNFINSDTSVKYNDGSLENFYKINRYTAKSRLDITLFRLLLTAAMRADYLNDNLYTQYGLEGTLNVYSNHKDINLDICGGVNSTKEGVVYERMLYSDSYNNLPYYSNKKTTFIEVGCKIRFKNFYVKLSQYGYDYNDNINLSSGNYSLAWLTQYFDAKFSADRNRADYLPDFFLKSDVSFHNYFFDNHLNLRIGINLKYATKYSPQYYDEYRCIYLPGNLPERELFNMDAYIAGRIGSANLTLTFANIFDHMNYTTALYPFDERGGLANSLARFSIVWDFSY